MWLKFLASSVVVLVALKYAQYNDVIPPLAKELNASYDCIIVGAGSAGCVLANRLSEDNDVTVLLIEAGPDDRGRVDISIPALAPTLHQSDVNNVYFTVPQNGMEGFQDKRKYWPTGRVLGGSSSTNYMQYVRGCRQDYDQWAAQGCDGWSYKDVLPYFIKSEKMEDIDRVNADYHGREGPLRVEVAKTGIKLTDVLLEAATEMGLRLVDHNAETAEGISYMQQTAFRGQRSSTSRAFLHPVLTRSNLHVVVDSFVTKVLFQKKRAKGVELLRGSRKQVIYVNREVILSAGTIGSSKLLLLSGVGPKQHLKEMKISVLADLPVGENLQNHLSYDYQVTVNQPISVADEDIVSWWSGLKMKLFGTGPLTTAGDDVQLFVSTSETSRQQQWPDIHVLFLAGVWNTAFSKTFGFTQQALKDMSARDNETHGFVCLPVLMRPKSRGTIRLNSADPFDDPLIDPKYLTHPDDLDTLVRGVSVCQKLAKTRSFQAVGGKYADTTHSVCSAQGMYDTSHPQYWRCLVNRNAHSLYHYSGTCKMGAASDQSAVVDPQLRVRGLDGLRIVDASVFPTVPSTNTNAAVIMVAEKAADIIRQSHQKGQK